MTSLLSNKLNVRQWPFKPLADYTTVVSALHLFCSYFLLWHCTRFVFLIASSATYLDNTSEAILIECNYGRTHKYRIKYLVEVAKCPQGF